MLKRLETWLVTHPDALVMAAAMIMVGAVRNFDRALELRGQLRRDAAQLAREASEALGG
jgi:hypothetical protein